MCRKDQKVPSRQVFPPTGSKENRITIASPSAEHAGQLHRHQPPRPQTVDGAAMPRRRYSMIRDRRGCTLTHASIVVVEHGMSAMPPCAGSGRDRRGTTKYCSEVRHRAALFA